MSTSPSGGSSAWNISSSKDEHSWGIFKPKEKCDLVLKQGDTVIRSIASF